MTPHKYILHYFQSPGKQRQGFPYHNCCPPEDLQHDLSVFLNAFVVTCFLWIGLYPCLSYNTVMTFVARSKMAIPQALFTFSPFCWTIGIAGKMSCLPTIKACLPQLIFRLFSSFFYAALTSDPLAMCFTCWPATSKALTFPKTCAKVNFLVSNNFRSVNFSINWFRKLSRESPKLQCLSCW